jgi:hypothetical protein
VEEEAKQPTAVPNGQGDDYTQGQDLEAVVEVEVEAGPYEACGHDVECDDRQDCQGPVDLVHSVEQQFGHAEEC